MSSSRFILGLALAFVLLASVNAHGWMSHPTPRGQYRTPPKYEYEEYASATKDPNDPNIACRGDPVAPKANWIPLTAGGTQSINLVFNAKHVGDCFVYLSYDGDKSPEQMKWFKIWERHECKNQTNYDIRIPDYLPSGEHVVFRWEWYALHVYPIVEYYSQCADATMTGSSTGMLPQPQVNIPGHLPVLSGNYADNTNNYWWPWDNQPMFFTGPPVATPNGQVSTVKPTTPTTEPTTAPATSKPTSAPATAAPTSAPATAAPVTAKPTAAPTNAPATSAPVTTPPVALATTKPSGSAKCRYQFNQEVTSTWSGEKGQTSQYTVTLTVLEGSVKNIQFTLSPASALAPGSPWSVVKNVATGSFSLQQWMYNSAGVVNAGTTTPGFGYIINGKTQAIITVVGDPCA